MAGVSAHDLGEPDNEDNDYITNVWSNWDKNWHKTYGGVDDPKHRKGYFPAGFTPSEDPFYVALPYGEFLKDGTLKRLAEFDLSRGAALLRLGDDELLEE